MGEKMVRFFEGFGKEFSYDGFFVLSQQYNSIFEMSREKFISTDNNELHHWVFHHSHGDIADPSLTYK